MQLLQICQLPIHASHFVFNPIVNVLNWDLETISVDSLSCLRYCVLWCGMMFCKEMAIRRWLDCGHKGMHMGQEQYSRLLRLNDARFVLNGQKLTLHRHHQPEMLNSSLHQILTLPCASCSRTRHSKDQATFFQSSAVRCWWACLLLLQFSLSAYLCCNMVICYGLLPVSLNQSGHSPH